MAWTFYNSSGELQINDGGSTNPATANFDLASYLLVGNAGSTGIAISANGEVTMAAQPSVSAANTALDSNVTGNSTVATVDFNSEIFDQNADFASDTFTAPVTGKYLVLACVRVAGLDGDETTFYLQAIASNYTWVAAAGDITKDANSQFCQYISAVIDMDASDTCTIGCKVGGTGTDSVDISGDANANGIRTFVSYHLLA